MGKLNKYSKKEKQALALQREMAEFWAKMRKAGYVKLDKPVRDGWEVQWKIRDDIARSKNGEFMQKALNLVKVTPVYCDNKKCFKIFKYGYVPAGYEEIVRSKKGVKVKVKPDMRRISKKEYDELEPKVQRYFVEHVKDSRMPGVKIYTYGLTLTYELDVKVSRSYITHKRIIDPELDKRFDEVSSKYYEFIYDGTLPNTWKDWAIKFKAKRERMQWRRASVCIRKGEELDDLEFEPIIKKGWW